jgi:hypothetical protein
MSLGRFTPLGWTRGLLAILAGLIVSFFLFGFFNPYWQVADQDILLTMRRVFDTGVFQTMLIVWIASGMLAFGLLWRTPLAEGLTATFAVIAGVSFGLLSLYFYRATSSIARVISPLDALYYFVAPADLQCGPGGCGLPFTMLFDGIKGLLAHHTFFLHTSPRPEIFLEWVIIAGIANSWLSSVRARA